MSDISETLRNLGQRTALLSDPLGIVNSRNADTLNAKRRPRIPAFGLMDVVAFGAFQPALMMVDVGRPQRTGCETYEKPQSNDGDWNCDRCRPSDLVFPS